MGCKGITFFIHFKQNVMTTYIVKEKNELHIYQVREDQKEAFLADYGPKTLMEGDSIQDAIIKFDELPVIIVSPD